MTYSTGKLSFIFIVAVLLAAIGAWWLARRYARAMKRLMSAPLASAAPATSQVGACVLWPPEALPPPAPVSLAQNRRAGLRLTLLLTALSLAMALSSAALTFVFVMHGDGMAMRRLLVLALVHLWPVIPAIGLLWRWPSLWILGVLALWVLLCFGVMWWRSIEPDALLIAQYLAFEIGVPLVLIGALCLGQATRAAAPWLLPPLVLLVWASIAGLDVLWLLIADPPRWLMALSEWLGADVVMLLFAMLPWLVAWWPMRWLGRALGRAYTAKRLSELMVLFTAVWAVSLLYQSLGAASGLGLGGVVMMLPLLWIPLFMALSRRLVRRHGARPPTLLVLRVFQHDHQVQALFDAVVERWRLTGNTVLIAGTDLALRTLDAEDIFAFLDRRLSERFIHSPADVPARLAAFDLAPDAEGRMRINECYCHDTTWQQALHALVQQSDVVLMDLRGFQAHNAGCTHELGVLARARSLRRVVALVDAQTDRAAADAAITAATARVDAREAPTASRFVWLDAPHGDARRRGAVLASLFGRPA
ncbi:hypothetical protein BH11PSE8_BH11PSE8_05820 [soil metagenome]